MRVGFSPSRFRSRVVLQRPIGSALPGPGGDPADVWSTWGTVAAEVVALSGRELVNAQQAKGTVDHRIRCRYFTGGSAGPPTETWRGLWQGKVLNFVSVLDVDSARRYWEILATVTTGETTSGS